MITALLSVSSALSQKVDKDWNDGEIFLKLVNSAKIPAHDNNGITKINDIKALEGLVEDFGIYKVRQPFHMTTSEDLKHTVVVYFNESAKIFDLLYRLKGAKDIDYAERIPYYTTTYTPNDLGPQSGSGNQWGLYQIQAEQAWNISTGNPNVTVAVVDNAVDITHPDLAPAIWTNPGEIPGNGIDDDANGYIDDVNGWDAGDNDNDPNPPTAGMSHGTHCAGTVGSATDNGVGVASIGFGISLIPVKANRNSAGNSAVSNAYDGFTYAATVKADVISNSWGGGGFSSTYQNMMNWAYNTQGCLIIAAAGNSNTSSTHYPSGYANVISVASSTTGDVKSSFSNYGTWVDITAPGSNILSTYPNNNYQSISGTSMATPLVAGLCGLMFSVDTTITRSQVESCLSSTADNIDAANPGYIGQLGAGRINAYQALQCIQAFTSPVPPVAAFYSNDTLLCVGASADFFCTTGNATTFAWSFQGGSPATSTLRNPTGITYAASGFYDVTLTVTNAYGNHQITKTAYINVDPSLPCPITLPPNTTMPTQTNCIGKLFDDGGPTAAYTPNQDSYVTIAPTGATQVTLNFTSFDVESGATSPSPPCGYDYMEVFDGPTTSSPSLGKFCNANTPPPSLTSSGGSVTIHFHTDPGLHLQGFEIDWTCSTTSPPPVADFTGTPTSICAGASVNFTDASQFATSWSWTFTGGTPASSTAQNPSVVYSTPGTYAVSLTASNGSGNDTETKTGYITVVAAPTANFTNVVAGLNVNFTNTSNGGSTYQWDFGDGNTSTTQSPSHTYAVGGTYTVCLTVSGPSCPSDSVCKTVTVSGGTGGLIADFSVSTNTICQGGAVDFYDQSVGAPTTYQWTFQGGTPSTSTAANPTNITYNGSGNFDVTLVVSNGSGSNSITKTGHINVFGYANARYTSNILGRTVHFSDLSVNATSWSWDFGDGNTSTQQSPVHTYAADSAYVVCLTVTNPSCPANSWCENVITNSIGLDENIFNGEVKVYPNPANELINIDFKLLSRTDIELKLIDNVGKVLSINKYDKITELKESLDLSQIANGTYILIINNKHHYKVVKQ